MSTSIQSGRLWTMNVTEDNLDERELINDFTVTFNGASANISDFVKLNKNTLQYTGTPITTTTVVVTKLSGFSTDAVNQYYLRMINSVGSRSKPDAVYSVPFSTSLAFDARCTSYDQRVINTPTTFTLNKAGAKAGNIVLLRLYSDGVNTPLFSGCKIADASMGWSATAGILQLVQIECDSSSSTPGEQDFWVTILHEEGQVAVDITPPVLIDSVINFGTRTVTLLFNKALSTNALQLNAFAVTGNTVNAAVATGSAVILTLSQVVTNNVTVGYTAPVSNGIESTIRSATASFTVTVPQRKTVGSNVTATNVALTGSGEDTLYTATGAATWTSAVEYQTAIPANTDGYIMAKQLTLGGAIAIGLKTTAGTASSYSGMEYGVFLHPSSNYYVCSTTTQLTVFGADNDDIRIKRVNGVMTAERRPNNSSQWLPVFSFAGTYFGPLFAQMHLTFASTSKATKFFVGGA